MKKLIESPLPLEAINAEAARQTVKQEGLL